ncbi:MAG: sigma-70 family RNA polymerase sigma factor [Actinomycetota bacterium]
MSERHDFDAIWRDTGPMIWRAVYAYAGGRRDVADDAVAEAFARAIARGDSVREPIGYLYRVAFRIASADLQQAKRQGEPADRGVADPDPATDLMAALRRLTPAQRASVYLHYRADLPVREVAAIMGSSNAAVKVHLMRGRRRLAEFLTDPAEAQT